jgi:AraC-like DNA-binding protein
MPRAQGNVLREDSLFILHSGEEFALQRPAGMELLAVAFEAEEFRSLLDERPWAAHARAFLSRSVLQAPVPSIWRLRQDLLAILKRPPAGDALGTASAPARVVFESLTNLFSQAADSKQAAGSASASHIVAECHHLVADSARAPLRIDALCLRLGTSRRTLQNSFRQVADTTPVHYLRSIRLNAVRGHLMSTRPTEVSVSQAATDQGFDHLGHFTERYKTLFEELPSQTSRRGTSPALRHAPTLIRESAAEKNERPQSIPFGNG